MKFSKEADIAASPEAVYAYLSDFTKHSEWTTPGHKVKIESPVSAVGATFQSEAHQFGAQKDDIKITDLAPARRIAYEVRMKNGDEFLQVMELQSAGQGTHLVKSVDFAKMTIGTRLMIPIILFLAPKILAGDVSRIKERLEQRVSA